ncbi:MAG: diol dehydratase reactivase subunit alpha [Ruminococcaceae bacterium]|nr:diol dehydratase reactivase subunit alpha [Oscillospiraceae bacterium]
MANRDVVAGVDIGNSTTEAVLMRVRDGHCDFLSYAMIPTTGVKGTRENKTGVIAALKQGAKDAGLSLSEIDEVLINEATPVISELSTDVISQTTIIGSVMIGHNPDTPGGNGIGVGYTHDVKSLHLCNKTDDYIAVVDASVDFEEAAKLINRAFDDGISVTGIICKKDDGVLIANRLSVTLPIVDEVMQIEKIPFGKLAAVEVASESGTIKVLSNPYGIAGIFKLTPEETKSVIPISKSLIGLRSGVVINNDEGGVKTQEIPVGNIYIYGTGGDFSVPVSQGADKITETVLKSGDIFDIAGEKNTNTGNSFERIKRRMADLTGQMADSIKISDLSATDTLAPMKVSGGLANEYAMESVVMLSSMVKTSHLPMKQIADVVTDEIGVNVSIMGKEADNAIIGALTTSGADTPLAILDLGGGSTDAALMDQQGNIKSVHTAGAGEMVTTIIDLELALSDRDTAELIKRYPLARVETFNMLRFEDQTVKFTKEQLPPELYKRVVILTEDKMIPIRKKNLTMEQITVIRKEAKRKVFVQNALKALTKIAPDGNLRNIQFVVMVGGSALDFEVPDLINEALSKYNIVAGRGNVLGKFGPRAAVAAGLVLGQYSKQMRLGGESV